MSIEELTSALAAAKSENIQLRFLLLQAPVIEVVYDRNWAARAGSVFAYIHPKTLAKIAGGCSNYPTQPWTFFRPSNTKWVSTSLMPEGGVIFTSNALPGIANTLMEETRHA
jgi:hypothetical protein